MPLLSLLRFVLTLISLAILAGAAYLLWTWYDAPLVTLEDGTTFLLREDWRLWVGLALLAWSFLGKFLWAPLLAKPDRGEPTRAERQNGITVPGTDGATLYVEMQGPADGVPIVFTHGSAMDSTFWHYAKRALAQRYRVVSWDLPGYGKSRPGTAAVNLDTFADNLAAVVAFTGRPAIVVGHSMGGMTIQTLARKAPHLFGGMIIGVVLLNTTYTNPLKTMILPRLMQALQPVMEIAFRLQIWLQPLAWVAAWQSYLSGSTHLVSRFAFAGEVTRSQLNHVSLLTTCNPPAIVAKGNLAMFHWDATGAMAGVKVPVLVIGGDVDIVTKPEASRTITDTSPSGKLKLLPVNHMGPLEAHDEYNALIAAFAAEVASKPSAGAATTPLRELPA